MPNWENNVRKVVPYTPGEQPKIKDIIKLNTNENPYPPSPMVCEALDTMDRDLLRRYPDPAASMLVNAIAEHYGVTSDRVFVGVGSDDVLAMCFLTFFASGRPILFPDITYSFYDVWAELFRIPYETKSLDENFRIVNRDYYPENGGIIFPNPNAPTGILKPLEEIEDIVSRNRDVVVIVDEAYIDFADGRDGEIPAGSALNLLDRYENLLVVQTFSKSRSLAGMRIGFAIGSQKLIRYLNDAKYSFNSYTMNQTAICAGAAAVRDQAYFAECLGKIKATRARTQKALRELGFRFHESQSNFLFVTHEKVQARELFAALRKANIIVRYFDKPRIDNYLRITIGTDEQMDALTAFLKEYLSRQS